ncbi:hypothetical protein WI73_00230 [Burkholderia ubonensis]|uniref:Uncharacterized protein n=2 Tax=Burkholderia TaxID=32008 RepID=A0A102K997_9BURK|nr:hypothetical protein [Burkholderia ubonensis]KUZ70985.1 hypothetical protein WI37_25860 [Burkholderia ubonensis]KUZ72335.1 hypothetical protein WI36_18110 [Burkholderia ubonensis]KUZ78543.1 hypothetical protein WI35_03115 [Burkholderia ubonensis]KUZ89070.1 hypothetical protein WI39_21705 [Burkholderia ubonensis]KUZ91482.1 hypothetical protein WI38_12025 [Burkholderia ubonensis]
MLLKRNIPVLAAALGFAVAAVADSPHFVKGPTATLDTTTGDYTVAFKEAGLGSSPVTYTLLAGTEQFTFQCFTKSHNTPQGAPNSVSFSNTSTQTTLTPRNGQVTGSVSLVPQLGGASCQGGGLELCLVAASYAHVTINDGLGNTVNLPDLSGDFSSNPICKFN